MVSISSSTKKDFAKVFSYWNLTAAPGKPTDAAIEQTQHEIFACASSIASLRGGRQHGKLGLVMTPSAYNLVSPATPYIRPVHPGDLLLMTAWPNAKFMRMKDSTSHVSPTSKTSTNSSSNWPTSCSPPRTENGSQSSWTPSQARSTNNYLSSSLSFTQTMEKSLQPHWTRNATHIQISYTIPANPYTISGSKSPATPWCHRQKNTHPQVSNLSTSV